MNLLINRRCGFTRWVVTSGLLRRRFVVVDAGVQGGESPCWEHLGDHLELHGFDPIREAVDALARRGRPNRTYHCLALGAEEAEVELFYRAQDPFTSSLYRSAEGGAAEARKVRMRRLDSLVAEGTVPTPDYFKMDVEGYEKHVLAGAREALAAGVLAVESETSFAISPEYPEPHLCTLQAALLEHRLLVRDLNFNRIPREAFQRALERSGRLRVEDQLTVGPVSTLNVLFCRDFVGEADDPSAYRSSVPAPDADALVKCAIIAELHGLNDVALELCERFRDTLGARLDVERAVALLADPQCRTNRRDDAIYLMKKLGLWRRAVRLRNWWRGAAGRGR